MLDLNNNLIPSKNVNLNNNDAVNMALGKEEAEDKKKQMEEANKKELKKKSSSFTSKINNKLLKYKADKLITQYLHLTSFDKKKTQTKKSKQSINSSSSDSSISTSSIYSTSSSTSTSNSKSKQVSLSKANQIFTITNICSLLSSPYSSSVSSSYSTSPLIDKHFFHKFSYFNSLLVLKALRLKQKPQSICSSQLSSHSKSNELDKTNRVDDCYKSKKLNEESLSTKTKTNKIDEADRTEKNTAEASSTVDASSKTKRMKRFASFKRREFILRLLDFNFLILF
jgi:hypothetical protein